MSPTPLSQARVDGPPAAPKIYHIVHVDRLSSIIADGYLWCDARVAELMQQGSRMGTTIGMNSIKDRRLHELTLTSHPDLFVGQCVPFYFCPRSVMLYLLYRANHRELSYTGGQDLVVHLEADPASERRLGPKHPTAMGLHAYQRRITLLRRPL